MCPKCESKMINSEMNIDTELYDCECIECGHTWELPEPPEWGN